MLRSLLFRLTFRLYFEFQHIGRIDFHEVVAIQFGDDRVGIASQLILHVVIDLQLVKDKIEV